MALRFGKALAALGGVLLLLAACGGGDGQPSEPVAEPALTAPEAVYLLEGQVAGLQGTVVLTEPSGRDLPLIANGPFTASDRVPAGTAYTFAISQHPPGQTCLISNGSGTAKGHVNDIRVQCTADAVVALPPPAPAPDAPTGLAITEYGVKSLVFSWTAAALATRYELHQDPDGPGPLPAAQVGVTAGATSYRLEHQALLIDRLNAQYTVRACSEVGCSLHGGAVQADVMQSTGYFKPSNTRPHFEFGRSAVLSADGSTLAVGAPSESSPSAGVNGDQTSETLGSAGAVFVFRRTAGMWTQEAYLKASNPGYIYTFGATLAISADGNTLAVGSLNEDSSAVGIDGVPDAGASNAGSVYVFVRTAGNWSQQAYVKAHNTDANDAFGGSLALSADGHTMAVGAFAEAGGVGGATPDPHDNSAAWAGAVYVFERTGARWAQQAYLKHPFPQYADYFGRSVALSSDGDILAVGVERDDSGSTGAGGNPADGSAVNSGAVFLFERSAGAWKVQEYLKPSNPGVVESFGASVALSGDGRTLAVGAPLEKGSSSGINGSASLGGSNFAGAVYVFSRSAAGWMQDAYIKATASSERSYFGWSVSLSSDAAVLAVGSHGALNETGAVYLFRNSGAGWQQVWQSRSPAARASGAYGRWVALSANGRHLAVGEPGERGSGTGIQGPRDAAFPYAGAVWLY